MERLKHKNKIWEERLAYVKDMERRLKAMIIEWRKADDKDKVVKMIHALLFKQKEKISSEKQQIKPDKKFVEIGGEIKQGIK